MIGSPPDGGSDNDDLGSLAIVGGVETGLGNPQAIVRSMLCGTNQCDECDRLDCPGQPYGELDRDGDKPDLLPCPPHFDELGFIE